MVCTKGRSPCLESIVQMRSMQTDVQAMYQPSSTARQLAEQKAALEGHSRAHLAWSGQAMVSNSLNVMQEAVETIRAAFLLPQKDLK